ncbi:MAG: hypothetical protein ACOY90_06610 [Candidatus Zhuqueibacterota bacterium]
MTSIKGALLLILLGLSFSSIYGGDITSFTVSPADNKAGESNIYTFSFTTSLTGNGTDVGIPATGRIAITFPAGFDVSEIELAQFTGSSLGDFSSIVIAGNEVTLVRDGTGAAIAGNTAVGLKVGVIGNNTTANIYSVNMETQRSDETIIDSGTSSQFTVIHNSLASFSIDTINNQIAGAGFIIVIYARDEYGNRVNSFSNTATLTDLTGTISPGVTMSFSTGRWSGSVMITKAHAANTITVTSENKAGVSNQFVVNPGTLHHFVFEMITSPQTAGSPITLQIIAKDSHENTVTGFAGSATLSDNTNTINPISTGAFSMGQWSGTVTITKKQKDVIITAAYNGVSDQTNPFNVNASTVDHFQIQTITQQTAGTPFHLEIYARDVYNNQVDQFTETVDISDLTGTISPVISGEFIGGYWAGNVTVTGIRTNNIITVERTANGTQSGSSNGFNVVHNSLDHFTIDPIPTSQTAGKSFNISMSARDAYNNVVSGFSGTASLSDLTGTISPAISGNFDHGTWSGNVTITQSQTSDKISATSGSKTGSSNTFNVNPEVVHHYRFEAVDSPKNAGQNFTITITAEDIYNNRVTTFNNSVDLSDPTGTINPATSGNFSSGQWTGQVAITESRSDITIAANRNGIVGESNTFNVNPASLHHFVIATVGTKAAGVPFTITVTAQDIYNNRASEFSGTVSIQDISGSISPVSSSAFDMGQWSGDVTIVQVTTNDRITVTNLAGAETGNSNYFDIVAGNIDHFDVSSIVSPKTAGSSFTVTVTAKDANGATVTDYTGTANLNDLTGTLSPKVTTNFEDGEWSGSLSITKSYANDKITVTGAGKSGSSNEFNVQANTLDHFTFGTITSPKTAGTGFIISIEARDMYENLVTSFSSAVGLNDDTGTIMPKTTTNFSGGQWSGSVTITRAQNDIDITANYNSVNGTSNKFNVQAGALNRFVIDNLSTQQANEAFSIIVTAQDNFGNVAKQFTGRVNMSDLTGTLSPTESGLFSDGRWSGSVLIPQAYENDIITVVNQAGSETGSSNMFDVVSSSVDRFVIDFIGQQKAGQAFTLSIEAQDNAGNIVTSFAGTVTIADLTGAISPKTSGNFSNGEWSGNVTITQSLSANQITVTSSGKAGTSNNFNVTHTDLDHFAFDQIESPKTAGQSFQIVITAEDVYNNRVTSYASTVNLTDDTGTLTPPASGAFSGGQWSGNVTITASGTDVVITANGGGKAGYSNAFNINPASLNRFVLETITTQAANGPFTIGITAQDNFGNTATQFTGKVNISDLTSTISPTESGTFDDGRWYGNVVITQAIENDVISVVNQGGSQSGTSNSFDVISSTVDRFVIGLLGNQIAGKGFTLSIEAQDNAGNLVTNFSGTASLSDLTGSISPATTGSFSGGRWSGTVRIIHAITGDQITVTSGGKAGNSNSFNVTHDVLDHFTFTPIGSPQTAGQAFQIKIVAEDVYENKVTSFTGAVNLSDNTGTLTPGVTTNFFGGEWQDNVQITSSGSDNLITATGAGKTGTSNDFNVNAAALNRFAIETITTQAAGEPFTIRLTAQDAFLNTTTQFSGKVNISDGTGTVSPTASGNFEEGRWSGNVVVSQAFVNNTISVVNQSGSQNGISNYFDVISSSVDRFVFNTISQQVAGASFIVSIQALDAAGNVVTNFNGTASLSDLTGTISPTTTANFSSGVWSGSVTITKSRTANQITVTSSGKAGNSNNFDVIPASLHHFTIENIPSPQGAGTAFQITVYAMDSYENRVTSFNTNASLSDGTGTISPTVTGNFSSGRWIGNVTITRSQTDVTITVTRDTKTGVSNIFNVSPGALSLFQISNISTQAAGEPFYITVTALDANSNVATHFSGTVNISDLTGTVAPTVSNNFDEGKWSGNVTISQVRTGNRITVVNSGGSQSGQSNTFDVISSDVDQFLISTITSPKTAGVPFEITITAVDADNNVVTSFTGTASLADQSGTIFPTTTTNFSQGRWTGNITLTKYWNNNNITVTSSGKAGISNNFTVLYNALDHYEFDTITSPQTAGTPFTIKITAKDFYNNIVYNHSTPVTLSDNSNTITPTVSGNFSSGSWSGAVTLTKRQNDVQITATGSGKTNQSNKFNVNSAVLHHFVLDTVTTQAAGEPFQLTVTAMDSYANIVSTFAGTVDISDLTGTISPQRSGSFLSGKWTGNVTITLVRISDRITVVRTGGAESGNSTYFDVVSSDVSEFTFDAITSPKTAGQPFTVRITARDDDNNVVNTFNGLLTLNDLTGTITPKTTGAFTNGIWSGDVKITKSYTNDKIVATGLGKSGESNLFTMNPGSLDHFIFQNITSPQRAGQSFEITVIAKDSMENTVTNFAYTANLSDNTGTISPTTTTNFTNGAWSDFVRITKKQNDVFITASRLNETGTSNLFNVNAGNLASLKVMDAAGGKGQEIGDKTITLDDKISMYAAGFDSFGNYSRDVFANWTASGTLDAPTPAQGTHTVFDPVAPGTAGKIRADSTGLLADSTGNISVGSIAYVKIRTAPNGVGIELGNTTITADENLALYCAGYDAGNNYVGDMSVQWSSKGTLVPAVFDTGSVINFMPSKAPASGKIYAVHPTAADDSTGTIVVNPGVPVGIIVLTPTPAVIPATGTSSSVVVSDIIRDAELNVIAKNTQFTVTATLGTLTTTDVNPLLPNIQIAANDSGKIQFTLQSTTAGGTAYISVSSVNGSATGNTTVMLSNLNIVSVTSTSFSVSQGQTSVPVDLVVENLSASTISNLASGLVFTGPAPLFENRNADFPSVIRTDGITSIPSGGIRTLKFLVTVSANARTDSVTIDGWISGLINSVAVNDTFALAPWKWVVQTPPILKITRISSLLTEVSQGRTGVNVSMTVLNQGQATANVTLDTLSFWSVNLSKSVTGEYQIIPSMTNPQTIPGTNGRAKFDFTVNIGSAATLGQVIVNGEIRGTDANSGALKTDNSADTTHAWVVQNAPIVGITGFYPSQLQVTKSQTVPWSLTMIVANNGGTAVRLDSARTSFLLGGTDVSAEYTVSNPIRFVKSGTNLLAGGTVDTLKYIVTKTGASVGQLTIRGMMYLRDMGTGNPISDETYSGVLVQEPAQLRIVTILPSQTSVTRNQGQDWFVRVVLNNEGGSEISIDTNVANTFIRFSTGNDFVIRQPDSLSNGGLSLEAGTVDTLVFTIDGAGTTPGNCIISSQVWGWQTTSGDSTIATFTRTAPILVQEPAKLRILSVVSKAPNFPNVNKAQVFPVHVTLENNGDDEVANAYAKLTSSGNSIGDSLSLHFQNIPGNGGKKEQILSIKADSLATQPELFQVAISRAFAQNTNEPAGITRELAVDSTETVIIQNPARFQITKTVMPDSILASQVASWKIKLVVANSGQAGTVLEMPGADDITIKVNDVIQRDYFIEPPTALQGGGLELAGGSTDTLIYTVSITGKEAGSAAMEAIVQSNDKNDQHVLIAPGRYDFTIRSSAAVQLFKTEAICFNYDGEKGLVNRGQVFPIRVSVQNLGRKSVRDVIVQLTTSGNSHLASNQLTIDSINYNEIKYADFQITADSAAVNLNELFTSEVLSAIEYDTGFPAVIDNSGDSRARIAIHDSARLQMSAWTETGDSVYTISQQFTVNVQVANLGELPAGVDESGLIGLFVPESYRIIVGEDTLENNHVLSFLPGEIQQFSILTPEVASGPDSLFVSLLNTPRDKNINQRAQVARGQDTILVRTEASNILYSTSVVAPDGALDKIVSTHQLFRIQSSIRFSGNLTNVEAILKLPDDIGQPQYSFQFHSGLRDTVKDIASHQPVLWDIVAPDARDEQFRNFEVTISATEKGNPVRLLFRDSVNVKAVNRARLNLNAEITSPEGAREGRLTVGQNFEIKATVSNMGDAATFGQGFLKMNLGSAGFDFADTSETHVKPFAIDTAVVWNLKAPAEVTSLSYITVVYEDKPNDENTGMDAWTNEKDAASISVETVEAGDLSLEIFIQGPEGAKDSVLSSYQEFVIGATVTSDGVKDIKANMQLPNTFLFATDVKPTQSVEQGETIQWRVIAAPDSMSHATLKVTCWGDDENDATIRVDAAPVQIAFKVVRRFEAVVDARIISPPEATDNAVSVNQEFFIQAALQNIGQAPAVGTCTFELSLPEGYVALNPLAQTVQPTENVLWKVKAPATALLAKSIEVRVPPNQGPEDNNAGKEIHFWLEKRGDNISIITNQKTVVVSKLPNRTPNAIVKGQRNVSMLGLRIFNRREDEYSNKIVLTGLEVRLKNRLGQPIDQPGHALSRIAVTSYSDAGKVYGSVTDFAASSLIPIYLALPDTIYPDEADSIDLVIDIAQSASATDIMLSLEADSSILILEANTLNQPQLTDLSGQTGAALELESDFAVVLGDNLKQTFMNYPNPFGSPDRKTTTITYYLKEDTDVDIKIYTLIGELVWSRSYRAGERQARQGIHDGDVIWDGTNDRGYKVLNGVYVIYFKSAKGETAMTKAAVIK